MLGYPLALKEKVFFLVAFDKLFLNVELTFVLVLINHLRVGERVVISNNRVSCLGRGILIHAQLT